MAKRDFLTIPDLPRQETHRVLSLADDMKAGRYREKPLRDRTLEMVFAKSSTRTRVSFEVDEGPILKEERVLIDEVATRIGAIAVRIVAEKEVQEINKQLSLERVALQEANAAHRTVLAKIEDEKKQVYRDMQINVEKVIMPILHALSVEVPKAQRKYVEILRNSREEMTSPFISKVVNQYHSLSPTEISLCNMIRNGMRTNDIAQLRGVSAGTVNRHRENIRKKLRITNDQVNLATYLQSLT